MLFWYFSDFRLFLITWIVFPILFWNVRFVWFPCLVYILCRELVGRFRWPDVFHLCLISMNSRHLFLVCINLYERIFSVIFVVLLRSCVCLITFSPIFSDFIFGYCACVNVNVMSLCEAFKSTIFMTPAFERIHICHHFAAVLILKVCLFLFIYFLWVTSNLLTHIWFKNGDS